MLDFTRFRAGVRLRCQEILTRRGLRSTFRNTDGAIDLASIMVGVLVIGIVAAVIAATVIAVVPWSQDNAAKQDLDAVKTAESVAKVQNTKFLDMASLVSANRIQANDNVNVATDANGTCYVATSKSATGAYFWSSDTQPQPQKYVDGDSSTCTDLGPLVGQPTANMISTWDTSLPGCSTIELPITGYDASINWGDGSIETATGAGTSSFDNSGDRVGTAGPTHTYTDTAGPHTVSITGTFTGFHHFMNGRDVLGDCLTGISRWRDTGTTDLTEAFADDYNLKEVAEIPSTVTTLKSAFSNSSFSGDISNWDVANVTDMSYAFQGAYKFNSALSSWDTSKVTTMNWMFNGANVFNQNLSGWNVSSVASHYNFAGSALTAANTPSFTS